MSETKPFNVADYEMVESATLTVKNKGGAEDLLGPDGLPVKIELWSPGSEEGTKAKLFAARRVQLRLQKFNRGEELSERDFERAERENAERLAAYTKSISANFPIAPLALYSNPKLSYISQQVEAFLSKAENF